MHRSRPIFAAFVAAAVLASNGAAFASESVEALIKRQSQEFSDASASGDAAVLGRYLDDRVVFMNETGEIATRKDIIDSATPTPRDVSRSLTQTDFVVQVHGSTAVTSFTDALTQQFHGQTLHLKFLSTEVWLKEGRDWKMISSQTMTREEAPPAIALPAATWDEYVGTYKAGDDFVYKVARAGDGIAGAASGAEPVAMKAEFKDIMFTPGQPDRRKIFKRDAGGKVTGLVFRRAGQDIVLARVD